MIHPIRDASEGIFDRYCGGSHTKDTIQITRRQFSASAAGTLALLGSPSFASSKKGSQNMQQQSASKGFWPNGVRRFARKDEIARWALEHRENTPILRRGPFPERPCLACPVDLAKTMEMFGTFPSIC